MIARLRPIAVVAALLVAVDAPALAQEDSVLQRYDLAVENLEFAIASVPGDPVQARDELERAVNALLTLSRDTTSATLLEAMQRTFERARTAVDNSSSADLAVQSAVLKGGFRRLVADSAFTAGAGGDLATAQSRLTHIAQDMGFSAPDMEALAAAGSSLTSLRLAFEAGVAETVAAEMTVAGRLMPTDRAAAYESLATAYGDSLLIQDSPRADVDLSPAILRAAHALVQNDPEAFDTAAATASAHLTRLASSARAGDAGRPQLPSTITAEAQPETDTPEAEEPPATVTETPAQPEQPEQAQVEAEETPAPQQPAQSLGDLPSLDQAAPAAEPVVDLALLRAQWEQERRDAELAALVGELEAAGLPAGLARSQATALMNAGFSSPGAAFDAVAARINEATAALRAGDAEGAHSAVAAARRSYESVRGLVSSRDAAVASDTASLFDSLLDRPDLRAQDLSLLAASFEAGRAALGTPTPYGGLGVERSVDSLWAGWPRLAVLFALGLLAIVPLRYLNIAFGGGNANWRLVAWALFLLLVPVFYEALASLGTAVARLADMPSADVLSHWSMFSSTTGHVVWAALVLIALVLATVGLRGICAQFGLLGTRSGPQSPSTPTLVESRGTGKQTSVDWDDEF